MKNILGLINSWKDTLIKSGWSSSTFETPGSIYIPTPQNHSDVVFNMVHEPLNVLNQAVPVNAGN